MSGKISEPGGRSPVVGLPFQVVEGIRRSRRGSPLLWALSLTLALPAQFILWWGLAVYAESSFQPAPKASARDITLEFAGMEIEDSEKTFVHANPEVLSRDPGPTRQFSTRDQVAAQEEESPLDLPEDIAFQEGPLSDSAAVYQGNPHISPRWPERLSDRLSEEEEPLESEDLETPPMPAALEGEEALAEEGSSSETEPIADEEGSGISLPDISDSTIDTEEITVIAGWPEALRDLPPSSEREPSTSRSRPEPQPRRQIHGPPLVQGQDQTRVPNIGRAAVESRETPFGHYLEAMQEAMVKEWHRLAWEMGMSSEAGSSVRVRFVLDSRGEVQDLEILESSTRGPIGVLIIQQAIRSRAPYGPWSDAMKAVHGEQWEMKVTFHYN